jgi:hypothetical protein
VCPRRRRAAAQADHPVEGSPAQFFHADVLGYIESRSGDCGRQRNRQSLGRRPLNQASEEIAATEHLFERMVTGAILILDDYEWSGYYRPQKLAEDEWLNARHYRVMPLPTGQGLVIKR